MISNSARTALLVFENVTVQPSPLWLQCRLTAIGLSPINNIVDMTNFVMAEPAQPMHPSTPTCAGDHLHPSGETR
jgi:phenylalanyl-tRNA synthetase beta subunit